MGGTSPRYVPVDEPNDNEQPSPVELTQVPKSRAPSYVSSTKNSFWDGVGDDHVALIGHAQTPYGFDLAKDAETARRRDTLVSVTSTNRDKKKHWLAGNRYGWHFGVSFATGTAATVLWLNLFLTIFAAVKFGIDGGVGTVYEGSCEVVNRWTTWLHIVINVLSSLLLSASNYTMQALSAPTRKEVDSAHARGDWLDIGVPSMRNLFRIKWQRSALWVVLAISSVPIHLLYNSAVFKTIDSNEYSAVVANERWLQGGNYSVQSPWAQNSSSISYTSIDLSRAELDVIRQVFTQDLSNATLFRNLSNTECINTYSANYVSGYNYVMLVTKDLGNATNETLFFATQPSASGLGPTNSWMCDDSSDYYSPSLSCDTGRLKQNANDWVINRKKIDHCIAQIQPQHCTLQFSVQILVAVIVCNFLKSASMLATLYRQKEVTLVTMGDAIASFLDNPDTATENRCLMSRTDVGTWRTDSANDNPDSSPLPKTFFAKQSRWFSAASAGRWIVTFLLIISTIIASAILLYIGSESLTSYGVSPMSLGFGAIDGRAVISINMPTEGPSGLVSAVLLANLPQAIVSFLYLLYNSLTTCLMLAREWSTYCRRRKPLRVTTPYGAQRSTYYLQLPFRYSGPLLAISATLHWVISQSIFLARINTYVNAEPTQDSDISSVGYSCPAILTAILIGCVLLVGAFIMGFQKFRGQMPVVSSCSVAIAAACHPPKDDIDAAYLPVQWGEVHPDAGLKSDEVGHACFTSYAVDELTPGRMYAGASKTSARHASMSNPSRRIVKVE